MSGSAPQRVVVFLDCQSLYRRARDAFCSPLASPSQGQVDSLALGHLLAGRVPGGYLTGARVYRGRPSRRRDSRSHGACRRHTARQVCRGGGLAVAQSRELRYPPEWPRRPVEEKGIEVAILFSSDMDLVPALEAVLALRSGDPAACEVAAWAAPGMRPRSLSVRGVSIWRHLLSEADYRSVADLTDYARS